MLNLLFPSYFKAYMRRVSATINYGRDMPISHGISFHSAQVEAVTDTAEGVVGEAAEVASALNKLAI